MPVTRKKVFVNFRNNFLVLKIQHTNSRLRKKEFTNSHSLASIEPLFVDNASNSSEYLCDNRIPGTAVCCTNEISRNWLE